MSILHFQTVFLLFYRGSLAFTKEQFYQDQFNFCWKQTIDNREENQTFCCSSGRIKFDDLSYCKNDTSTCVSNALCDINECCNGTDQHLFSAAQAYALYTNCSYKTNCSVNWADKVFLPPGFQGHVNNIINYTCIKDSMVLKMCEDNFMTAGQVELVLDGKKPGVVSSSPSKCECSLSIDPNYGSFSVDLTDLRFAKPSNSSCSTATLNMFGLSFENCSGGPFNYKGTFAFTSNDLKKLSIEHLFELGVEDIPSMIWITIKGNSSSITVNCSAMERSHDVTYYTYSAPSQTTSSTDHAPCTKMTTTQYDRKHFSTTNAAETTGTTRAVGPVTNITMSEISIQHGDSTSVTVNSRAAQTMHNGTSYSSRVQATPSSLYTSWTKLLIAQDDIASYSPSNVTDNTGVNEDGNNLPTIIGVVIAAISVIAVVVVALILFRRKIQDKALKTSSTEQISLTRRTVANNVLESINLNPENYASLDKCELDNAEYDQLTHDYINTIDARVEGGHIVPNYANIPAASAPDIHNVAESTNRTKAAML